MSLTDRLTEMSELPELPRAAYSNFEQSEISDEWLASADPEEQVAAMVEWFHARFQDPAHETPYVTSEGGYIWTRGGPYDASEELQQRFDRVVSFEVIEAATEQVVSDGIWDWAPTQLTYYSEEQDVFIEDKDIPLQKLEERLNGLLAVLNLRGDAAAMGMARNLTYAGMISVLEAFLWETMAYWVEYDERTVRNLVKDHPAFKDRKVPLGSIFEVYENLNVQVRTHMQRMTWHRWDEARSLIEHGLGIKPPGFDPFDGPTKKRHDIIHRSGHDVDGNLVSISVDEVLSLAEDIRRFAVELHRLIDDEKAPKE